jgi:uncharacterized membrane protein
VRELMGGAGGSYAAVALAAVVPYLISAALAGRYGRTVLGPDDVERAARETLAAVVRGLAAGARHVRARRPALLGLAMITVHRFCYGLFAVCAVLLFRNYYHSDGPFRAGLAGLGLLVGAIAVGGGAAALVTPPVTRRVGYVAWSTGLLVLAGIVNVVAGLAYTIPAHLAGALLIAFCAQSIKISVDTTLQETVLDEFRGRVFALYDTLFNLALVAAAAVTALALPDDGHAPTAVVLIGLLYLLTAAVYRALSASAGRASA